VITLQWFVHVVGSYDSTFVGPFDNHAAAEGWAQKQRYRCLHFDYYPMACTDMDDNMAEFGACPVQSP
jgi:hypothetical protein